MWKCVYLYTWSRKKRVGVRWCHLWLPLTNGSCHKGLELCYVVWGSGPFVPCCYRIAVFYSHNLTIITANNVTISSPPPQPRHYHYCLTMTTTTPPSSLPSSHLHYYLHIHPLAIPAPPLPQLVTINISPPPPQPSDNFIKKKLFESSPRVGTSTRVGVTGAK